MFFDSIFIFPFFLVIYWRLQYTKTSSSALRRFTKPDCLDPPAIVTVKPFTASLLTKVFNL